VADRRLVERGYHLVVDRVDSWLNAQRGWRRFGVMFLCMLAPTAGLFVAANVWWRDSSSNSATHTTGQVVQSLVASVPVAAVLACLMLIVTVLANRRPGMPQWRRQSRITWRAAAGVALLGLNSVVSALTSAQPPRWRQDHWETFPLQLIMAAGALALLFWNARHYRRLSAQAAPPNQTL
jgi:hypothetical protein